MQIDCERISCRLMVDVENLLRLPSLCYMRTLKVFEFCRSKFCRRTIRLYLVEELDVLGARGEVFDDRGSEMKRRFEQDGDSSVLHQSLDAEAVGPSTDGDHGEELGLEPKHKIFLSHSGFQKDFAEQLCVDLERCHYYPFFDKRDHSLQRGRKFPELIFQAAKQCQVAVLILSEDFFTRTKWPMLEFEAFVEAQKKAPEKISILPVYLGISRYECTKNEARRLEWTSLWREWAKSGGRIDVEKWVEALKVLGPSNGVEYLQSLGEVTLREQIVSAVRGLVSPEITWSVGQIQGRTRICEAICKMFEKTKPSPLYGVRVVGIYGMGGVGKTTFCKVLCDELLKEFKGKVCHGELGKQGSFDLQKQALRNLTDIDEGILTRSTNEDMTINLLNQHIHQHRLFLAIDNVWQESIEEAKVYLRVGHHDGSIVMVTARSIDVLVRLNIDKSDCLEMPELEEEDAKHLFLYHAVPSGIQFRSEDDNQRILLCVRECKFQKGVDRGKHFHPLALKVLGAQLGSLGLDPQIWVENLSRGEKDKFNQFEEKEHPIFSILRRGYDSLSEVDQLLFMDSVLFHPSSRHAKWNHVFKTCQMEPWFARGAVDHMFQDDIYEWLSIVHHQSNVWKIRKRLQGLQAKSLLEGIGDSFRGVSVHDLYLEFAKMEVKRGALGERHWVWCDMNEAYPHELTMTPSGNCWINVKRISLKRDPYKGCIQCSGTLEGINWQHFANIGVLHLYIGTNEVLDLRGLRCLRSLELEWQVRDCNHGSNHGKGEGKLEGLGDLKNLKRLDLQNIHYAPCFEEIRYLISLEVLRLGTSCNENCKKEPLSPPKLDKCIHLQELVLGWCGCLKAFPDLSRLTSLRKVFFWYCTSAKEVVGLTSRMNALEKLSLLDCTSLCRIPGLSDVVSLQELHVESCSELHQLPDLSKLMKLQRLNIKGEFNQPLGFSGSMPLKELTVIDVKALPDLGLLRGLHRLDFQNFHGFMLPDFGKIIALEELHLHSLPKVQELPKLHKLSTLRQLSISFAENLHQLVLSDLVGLRHLDLMLCGNLVRKFKVLDLHRLVNLENLVLSQTPVRSLPSLKALTQLRKLVCQFMDLEELPDLTGLTLLECIKLRGCHELTSLGNLVNLPALDHLDVALCPKLKSLPNLRSFKKLQVLNLCQGGVNLSFEDVEALALLSGTRVLICDHLKLKILEMLKEKMLEKKMSMTEVTAVSEVMPEVVMEIQAKQLEFFTNWNPIHCCVHTCCFKYK